MRVPRQHKAQEDAESTYAVRERVQYLPQVCNLPPTPGQYPVDQIRYLECYSQQQCRQHEPSIHLPPQVEQDNKQRTAHYPRKCNLCWQIHLTCLTLASALLDYILLTPQTSSLLIASQSPAPPVDRTVRFPDAPHVLESIPSLHRVSR